MRLMVQLARALEYTDCISAGDKTPSMSVLYDIK